MRPRVRSPRYRFVVVVLVALAIAWSAAPARAQSQVRVNDEQTTIWRPGFTIVAEIVSAGTVLDVAGKTGSWYEVELPGGNRRDATGFIAMSRVTPLDRNPIRTPSRRDSSRTSASSTSEHDVRERYAVRLFVQGGYGRFTAKNTFDAVLGSRDGGWFGGGVQVRVPSGLFAEVAVDRFQKVGSRVFVLNGEVFDLGTEDKLRMVPVTAAAGYRLSIGRYVPYASVGAGRVFLRETSPGAREGENVDARFAFYQAIVGLEVPASRVAAVAFEAQYSTTPDALDAGAGLLFGERDLGGVQFRAKLLFGR